jgi:hypothetical protein
MLYGQDSNGTMWSICVMNMILHNITRFEGPSSHVKEVVFRGAVRMPALVKTPASTKARGSGSARKPVD